MRKNCFRKKIISPVLLLLAAARLLTGQKAAGTQPGYRVPYLDAKVKADGVLDEPIWQDSLSLELNYEISPGENIKPPVRTEVFIAHGKNHLYIAFHAYDPDPSAIRARLTDRDSISGDDWVGISLDTFNDQRRIYSFLCNPLGIQSETVETTSGEDPSWDTIWASAGRITNDGYIVEMVIPFQSLRFQREKEAQVWGFNLARLYPRNLTHQIQLMPHDRNNFCKMCQMAKLVGFKGAKPGKNLEIDPSLSVLYSQAREEFPAGEFKETENKVDPGVTAHWGFTPNMTLSAAINPDFSHVEADAAQLDVNLQYALYYPEKRPFFMEGSSIFKTHLDAVYTRTLADPEWGVKLTGKEGAHSIGFYSVQDGVTNLLFPGSYFSRSTSLPMNTQGTVLRYRLDLGDISTLGLLVTDREGDDYFNRLLGLDTFFRLSKKKHLKAQFLTSQTRYPGAVADEFAQSGDKFDGTALYSKFQHESRNVGYYASYTQVNPGFRADLGFMPQVGYRSADAGFILASWRNPGHWYTFININPVYEYMEDYDGNLVYKRLKVSSYYKGPAQSVALVTGTLGKQSYLGQIFDDNTLTIATGMQPSGKTTLWCNIIFGDRIDFTNARGGTRFLVNPGINYKIGSHFSIDLDYIYEKLDVEPGRLYDANLANLRLVYQFNKRFFLRSLLQYVDYKYNVENYLVPLDPEYKSLFSQVLFSYKINPQTMLFLGYSDDHYGYLEVPLTQANRTIFLKIGYALVL